jgi:UDP-N-acetylglucosamine:LPS N-acetylglucosamine transferase
MSPKKRLKICLVSSSGGHLYKTYQLKDWWKKYKHFWVTREDNLSKSLLKEEQLYFAHFPENRNLINAIKNFFLAIKILSKEKPTLVFSIGAGIAPPFLLAAKLMGIKTVFMETFILIPKQTLSGRITYPFVDYFLVQNKKLLKKYPKAKYWGRTL